MNRYVDSKNVPHDFVRVPVEGAGPGAADVQNLEGALGPDDGEGFVLAGALLLFVICGRLWGVGGLRVCPSVGGVCVCGGGLGGGSVCDYMCIYKYTFGICGRTASALPERKTKPRERPKTTHTYI